MNNTDTLKFSWTMAQLWKRGDKQGVLDMIAGKPMETNIYMERGKEVHTMIASQKLLLYPPMQKADEIIFEDIDPDRHSWTNYFRVPLNDNLLVSGVIDVRFRVGDEWWLIDWKTGKGAMDIEQLLWYAVMIKIKYPEHKVKGGAMCRVDEVLGDVILKGAQVYQFDDTKIESTKEKMISIGTEIFNYVYEL